MHNEFFVSKCCDAEAQMEFSPDFVGDDPEKQEVVTCSFLCTQCGKPCDIIPLEEVIGMDKKDDEKKERDTLHENSLIITMTDNGYLVEGISPDYGTPISFVREEDEEDELKHHEKLLWDVIEYFGFGGSKHDKERLQIVRKKQK